MTSSGIHTANTKSTSIRNLHAHYNRINAQTVLEIENLEIAEGTIMALHGPNHCGKSTLLNVLARSLSSPNLSPGYEIRINGLLLSEISIDEVSHVHQNYSETLFPWASIRKNIQLRMLARKQSQEVMDSCMKELAAGIGFDNEDSLYSSYGMQTDGKMKSIAQLSGGQQQMIALLRSVLPSPRLLLLDEPFSALDIYNGKKFSSRLLEHIRKKNITTIMVTHSLEEAAALSDVVAIMRPDHRCGKIVKMHVIRDRERRCAPTKAEIAELAIAMRSESESDH